jgi:uroporphyrinogen-III decarboxylase
MRFAIDIDYPAERFEQNRKRMELRQSFQYADRVPVAFCIVPRFFASIFHLTYSDFFKDAETQFYWQLQFAKYGMENIPQDIWTCRSITVAPYFDNVVNADALGCEIGWSDNETPRAIPTIRSVEQVEAYEIPEPTAGLRGKVLDWHFRMKELAGQCDVRINGERVPVTVAPPGIGGEGPHMMAIDLVGDDFYWLMVECPEACHRFLNKITNALIMAEESFRERVPGVRGGFGLADDAATIMSPEMFREFCVPYTGALYDRFGAGLRDGRGMHMCGDSVHLHDILRDELKISSFNLFGYMVPPKVAAQNLGNSGIYLWGNIDPMLMLRGTRSEVRAAALRALNGMAPCGGFLLGDGANVCPGTPIENLCAVTEAAEEYGLPEVVR